MLATTADHGHGAPTNLGPRRYFILLRIDAYQHEHHILRASTFEDCEDARPPSRELCFIARLLSSLKHRRSPLSCSSLWLATRSPAPETRPCAQRTTSEAIHKMRAANTSPDSFAGFAKSDKEAEAMGGDNVADLDGTFRCS